MKSVIQEKDNFKTEKEQQENGSEVNLFYLVLPITLLSWLSIDEVSRFVKLGKQHS